MCCNYHLTIWCKGNDFLWIAPTFCAILGTSSQLATAVRLIMRSVLHINIDFPQSVIRFWTDFIGLWSHLFFVCSMAQRATSRTNKMPTRKWKRSESNLFPKELHDNGLMTDLGLYFFIIFNFPTSSPSFLPLFIHGSIWGQREKKRRKSEVLSTTITHFANQASQYKPNNTISTQTHGAKS